MTAAVAVQEQTRNRHRTDTRPAPKTAFKPGTSGNPHGRPKRTAQEFALIAACKEKAPAALHVVETLMTDADKDSVKLAAATFIIERAYGRTLPDELTLLNPVNLTQYNMTVQFVDGKA